MEKRKERKKQYDIVKKRWEKHIKTKLLFIQRREVPRKRRKGMQTWAKLCGRKYLTEIKSGRNLEKGSREWRACWDGESSICFSSKLGYVPLCTSHRRPLHQQHANLGQCLAWRLKARNAHWLYRLHHMSTLDLLAINLYPQLNCELLSFPNLDGNPQ